MLLSPVIVTRFFLDWDLLVGEAVSWVDVDGAENSQKTNDLICKMNKHETGLL